MKNQNRTEDQAGKGHILGPQVSSLPNKVVPDGLSVKRQWYLYKKVHEILPSGILQFSVPIAP